MVQVSFGTYGSYSVATLITLLSRRLLGEVAFGRVVSQTQALMKARIQTCNSEQASVPMLATMQSYINRFQRRKVSLLIGSRRWTEI